MYSLEWEEARIQRFLRASQIRPYGISFLDDALVGIWPNDLILIGAKTGRGKTELATTIALNHARMGRKVVFFALEADRYEIHERLQYRAINAILRTHLPQLPTLRFVEWASQGINSELEAIERQQQQQLALETESLRILYKGGGYTAEQLDEEFKALADDSDLFIIDHLHYFDLSLDNESEGLKRVVHTIRNLAIHTGKPVVLLAHLRKNSALQQDTFPVIEDFHGHSDIIKVATNVIMLSPSKEAALFGDYPTYFHIAKSRKASENIPYVGLLGFNRQTNTYHDKYFLGRNKGTAAPELITASSEIPKWFKNAVSPTGFLRGKNGEPNSY